MLAYCLPSFFSLLLSSLRVAGVKKGCPLQSKRAGTDVLHPFHWRSFSVAAFNGVRIIWSPYAAVEERRLLYYLLIITDDSRKRRQQHDSSQSSQQTKASTKSSKIVVQPMLVEASRSSVWTNTNNKRRNEIRTLSLSSHQQSNVRVCITSTHYWRSMYSISIGCLSSSLVNDNASSGFSVAQEHIFSTVAGIEWW